MATPTPQRAGLVSALIYTPLALLAAGVVFAATALTGDYTWVARFGGAGWVFLLAMIILMPTVTPIIKHRLARDESPARGEPRTRDARI